MENGKGYPIRVVSRMTGLSLHVIRVWERRYGVISPERTSTNRRLYNDENIEKLQLLKRLVDYGYNIGQIANIPTDQLKEMIGEHRIETTVNEYPAKSPDDSISTYLNDFFLAIRSLDPPAMEKILLNASVSFSQPQIIENLIIPVLEKLGEEWQKGNFRIYHEHMATTIIRKYLSEQLSSTQTSPNAPLMIVATPIGQNHEIGALIVALTAAILGWHIIYLGTNLPAEEIAAVTREKSVSVVLLSIIYPPNDPLLRKELLRLGSLLPDDSQLIVGGRVAISYRDVLDKIKAIIHTNLSDLRNVLQSLLLS